MAIRWGREEVRIIEADKYEYTFERVDGGRFDCGARKVRRSISALVDDSDGNEIRSAVRNLQFETNKS
jgi:hypothetical protein